MMNADLIRKMETRCFRCMKQLPSPEAVCSCGHDNHNRDNGPGFLRSKSLAGRYAVGRVIGRGGFGVTYIGYDLVNDARVAIKEYYPSEMAGRDRRTGEVFSMDPNMDYMFESGKRKALREVSMLSKLTANKNIVSVHEAVQENNTVYMIMEYIDGDALNTVVQRNGAMAPRTAYGYILALVEAVAEIQEKYNLSHSDISPDNIMLRSEGSGWTPVLVDFGAAQQVQDDIGTVEAKAAKQYFSAPELLTSYGKVNKSTDCFSLCVTLYYLLAGGIGKTTMDRYVEELPSLKSRGVNIGPNLEAVIVKGMSLDRKARYPDARALQEAMIAAVKKDGKIQKDWNFEAAAAAAKKPAEKKQEKNEKAIKQPAEKKQADTNDIPRKKPKALLIALIAVVLAAVVAVVVLVIPSGGGKEQFTPDLIMERSPVGVVFKWDTPGAVSYDVVLSSSDSPRPIRYNNTKAKSMGLPAADVRSGQHFELEVTIHFEDSSAMTVSESFDVD